MTQQEELAREAGQHLTHIQDLCREYPTQTGQQRRLTFASIRIAAEAIATLADDSLVEARAHDVREQVIQITSSLDELSDRYGSDDPDRCGACATKLTTVSLSGGRTLRYCTNCPTEILEAVREISDLTGGEVL